MQYECAIQASKGALSYQEDTAAVWPETTRGDPDQERRSRLLAVLADGMGGHAGGALASRMCCDSFLASVAESSFLVSEALRTALDASNTAIANKVREEPSLSGMGSTLVAAAFSEDGLRWISVGDSPLYLYRRGELALLNEDHSLAPALDQLAREGKISEDQARNDPRRHMLRSAITGEEIELIDVSQKALVLDEGDYVVLASDGIHTLTDQEIVRIVSAYGGDGPEEVAKALIRAVENLRAPYQDNTTVVVVRPLPPSTSFAE